MSSLEEINRDEWRDEPYLIELRGGHSDGQRYRSKTLPRIWRQQAPASLSDALGQEAEPGLAIADYRNTGSVTDDGAHLYAYDEGE